jgi:hypothetical protein
LIPLSDVKHFRKFWGQNCIQQSSSFVKTRPDGYHKIMIPA